MSRRKQILSASSRGVLRSLVCRRPAGPQPRHLAARGEGQAALQAPAKDGGSERLTRPVVQSFREPDITGMVRGPITGCDSTPGQLRSPLLPLSIRPGHCQAESQTQRGDATMTKHLCFDTADRPLLTRCSVFHPGGSASSPCEFHLFSLAVCAYSVMC